MEKGNTLTDNVVQMTMLAPSFGGQVASNRRAGSKFLPTEGFHPRRSSVKIIMRRNHLHNRFLCRPSLHASTSGHGAENVQTWLRWPPNLQTGLSIGSAIHNDVASDQMNLTTHILLLLQDRHFFSKEKLRPLTEFFGHFSSSADNFSFQERDWLVLALMVPKLKRFYWAIKAMTWKQRWSCDFVLKAKTGDCRRTRIANVFAWTNWITASYTKHHRVI